MGAKERKKNSSMNLHKICYCFGFKCARARVLLDLLFAHFQRVRALRLVIYGNAICKMRRRPMHLSNASKRMEAAQIAPAMASVTHTTCTIIA